MKKTRINIVLIFILTLVLGPYHAIGQPPPPGFPPGVSDVPIGQLVGFALAMGACFGAWKMKGNRKK